MDKLEFYRVVIRALSEYAVLIEIETEKYGKCTLNTRYAAECILIGDMPVDEIISNAIKLGMFWEVPKKGDKPVKEELEKLLEEFFRTDEQYEIDAAKKLAYRIFVRFNLELKPKAKEFVKGTES